VYSGVIRRIFQSTIRSTEYGTALAANLRLGAQTWLISLHIRSGRAGWAFDGNTPDALALFVFARPSCVRQIVLFSGARSIFPHLPAQSNRQRVRSERAGIHLLMAGPQHPSSSFQQGATFEGCNPRARAVWKRRPGP
jgi:hypothetical protein